MNTTAVRSTNKTPYEIVFGHKPNLISALLGNNEVHLETIDEIVEQDTSQSEDADVDFGVAQSSFNKMQHHEVIPPYSKCFHSVPTSPTRKRIRDETSNNLENNAEMMANKYSTAKRIKTSK